MFIDPGEDPTTRQDNYRLTTEAIENWHYTNQENPQDASSAFDDAPTMLTMTKPRKPKKNAKKTTRKDADDETVDEEHELLIEMWKNEVKDFVRRKNLLEHSLATLCKIAVGQCTSQVKNKLKAMSIC